VKAVHNARQKPKHADTMSNILTATVTTKRNRRNNSGVNLIPPADPKADFIARINSAALAYNAGVVEQSRLFSAAAKAIVAPRTSFKEIVAQASASGLFTVNELIETVKTAAKAAGMAESTASRALIDVGLRQRAQRSDKGKTRGETPATQTPPPAPAKPPTAESIAALVAGMAVEDAKRILAAAYHLVAGTK
jgi:hypothetical protein